MIENVAYQLQDDLSIMPARLFSPAIFEVSGLLSLALVAPCGEISALKKM